MTQELGNAIEGLKTFRRKLADRHPEFAAAERDEDKVRLACQQVRQNLRLHREARKLAQTEIATRLEVGQSAISKIENGQGDIGLMTLLRYADAIGVAIEITVHPVDDHADARASASTGLPADVRPETRELALALQEAQEHLARSMEEVSAAQERIAAAA